MKYYLKLNTILIIPILLVMSSCIDHHHHHETEDCIRGVGEIVTETRTLTEFDGISAGVVGNVFLLEGTNHEIRIESNANIIPAINTQVSNNMLLIDLDECIKHTDRLDFYVTTPSIRTLTFSGVGNVSTLHEINFDDLNVTMSGVGNLTLLGSAKRLDCVLSGIGDVDAFDLLSEDAEVRLSGIGNMRISADNTLDATLSGTGDILYKGNATVTATVTGTGNVRKVD